uniref:ORF2 n=1 Tax=Permutotetraviridae sp. TaxID=2585115 RepID=A0A7G1HG92_9VIRU|nr:ORF2 [Permutotetraviridae sp.]
MSVPAPTTTTTTPRSTTTARSTTKTTTRRTTRTTTSNPYTTSTATPLAPALGLVRYRKPKPLVFHHSHEVCNPVGCEDIVPIPSLGRPYPKVSQAVSLQLPHPLMGSYWIPWGKSDACRVNVSISLGYHVGYVYRGNQAGCFELVVTGKLSSTQCVLPAHCGAIKSTVVQAGWFSNSVLCVGVGPDRPPTLGGLSVPPTFHPYYNVEFDAGPNHFSQRFYVVFDGLYRLIPKWEIDNSVVMALNAELVVPPLYETLDGRFCYKGPIQDGILTTGGCSAETLDQLPCACRLPTLEGPEPTEDHTIRSAELQAVWMFARTDDGVRPLFGLVDESLQTHCSAYLTTTTYISSYLKSFVAHLLQAIWVLVKYVWSCIVVLIDELAAFLVSKRIASSTVWTLVSTFLLVERGMWPEKLLYQLLTLTLLFSGLQSYLIRDSV